MEGWIKLHRKITEKAVWQDAEMLKLWLHCLLKATHIEKEIMVGKQKVKLSPGQFVTGRFDLADEYNKGAKKSKVVPARTLWRWLKKFEEWGMLTIKSTTKYSVVTITNWHAYQQNDQQVTNKWPANGQQVTTNKNIKKDIYIVPTEQPDGSVGDFPNKKEVIAELVAVYRSIPGVEPKKADYSFIGKLFNDCGSGEVYGAIKALERRMENGPVDDPYSYLSKVARAKAAEAQGKVTPLRRPEQPKIPQGYNMPSLEDLEKQRQVEWEMEQIRLERQRKRREMNGA